MAMGKDPFNLSLRASALPDRSFYNPWSLAQLPNANRCNRELFFAQPRGPSNGHTLAVIPAGAAESWTWYGV
jgi:hypothetical protein